MINIKHDSLISPECLTVRSLLTGHTFEIPDYQRYFSWTEDQINELWDDLAKHADSADVSIGSKILPNPSGYFLGSIAVKSSLDSSASLAVIDGQQRILALTLIALVLADCIEFHELHELYELRTQLQNHVKIYDSSDNKSKSRLKFNDASFSKFAEVLLSHKGRTEREKFLVDHADFSLAEKNRKTDSPIRNFGIALKNGYRHLDKFIMPLHGTQDKATKTKRIQLLGGVFSECLFVIVLKAKTEPMAYTLFQTLNDRGRPLSQADLIKYDVIRSHPGGDKNSINSQWGDISEGIGKCGLKLIDFPLFIHFSYISRYGSVRAKDLHKTIKSNLENSKFSAKEYIDGLKEDSDIMTRLMAGDQQSWDQETNDRLMDIRTVLKIKYAYPLLLVAYRKYTEKQFSDAVKIIMNMCFRYMKVLDGTESVLVDCVQKCCENIREEGAKGPSEHIGSVFSEHASDTAFIEKFCTFGTSDTKVAYFSLYWIERLLLADGGTQPVKHGHFQHLEHIMPKKPTSPDWTEAYRLKTAEPQRFKSVIWRIGNLLALNAKINTSIQNKEFAHKYTNNNGKGYKDSGLKLPAEVLRFASDDGSTWNEQSINKRQSFLAMTYAVKTWPLKLD